MGVGWTKKFACYFGIGASGQSQAVTVTSNVAEEEQEQGGLFGIGVPSEPQSFLGFP